MGMDQERTTLPETENEYHLRLLSNAHYVIAGLGALGLSIPSVLVGVGLWSTLTKGVAYAFLVVGTVMLVLWSIYLILLTVTARFLRTHKHRTVCMITSGLNCLFLFGTPLPFLAGLGIFTFIVLLRDSVKTLFEP